MGNKWKDRQAEDENGPVEPVPGIRKGGEEPREAGQEWRVLSLAMRIGDALLSAGMSANDVVVLMLRITGAYGLAHVEVDVTYTAITATYYPSPGEAPISATRVVESDVVDYTLVQRLDRLSDQIQAGMPVEEAIHAYERLLEAPHPYPEWVATAANAGVGAAVVLQYTTNWKVLLITFLTGYAVDRLLLVLRDSRLPVFIQQLIASALIMLVAAAVGTAAHFDVPFFIGIDPTLVVVGGIIMLVAGMMFVGAAQDALDEFYITASARIFEVAMRTAGIVVGIIAAIELTRYLGAWVLISPNPVDLGPVAAQLFGAALTAAFFALSCYARPETTALSAAMGLLGWCGYLFSIRIGAGEVMANTIGALAAALVSTLLVRRSNVPGFALITAAVLPLVPGLLLYNGLIQIVGPRPYAGNSSQGLATLAQAAGIALGIAAGASFGTFLGRPLADQLHRIRERVQRERE